MGEEETLFLLKINVIRSVADFYLGHKASQDCVSSKKKKNLRKLCIKILKFYYRLKKVLIMKKIHQMKNYQHFLLIKQDQHLLIK